MKNTKKGFTLVELLVVIAILAILATVAVVGYTSFTRKADISNDTVISKELTTLIQATDINDPVENFDDVMNVLYDNGFYLANLNTKTEGCYFVWDAKNNQIILVDGNDGFKVLFSKVTPSEDKKDWYFAVSDLSKVDAIETAGYNVERMVTDIADLAGALVAGGEFHIDNSLVLDSENLLTFESNVTTTLNLGNASLNTNGVLENQIPIELLKGTLTINGGTIGAAGSHVDVDGKVVNMPILTEDATTTYINGTTFNISKDGFAVFAGDTFVNGATFNSGDIGVYNNGNGQVVLENTTINSKGRCVWSCNLVWVDEQAGTTAHSGTTLLTIKSGTYSGGNATYNPIAACGGQIVIEGGTFTNINGGGIFHFQNAADTETITVKGGTFNGKPFAEITTAEEWEALCNAGCTATRNDDGSWTLTK